MWWRGDTKLINSSSDNNLQFRYKTGDFPPTDIQFEEMELGKQKKSRSLTRRMSRTNFTPKRDKQNLFQKKRRLLKNIEKFRFEINKGTSSFKCSSFNDLIFVSSGTKEMAALQLMVQTYTATPEFGDASKFQEELDIVSQKVQKHEQDLAILTRDLDLVESKMNLNMRHSLLTSPSRSLLSLDTSSNSGSSSTGTDSDKVDSIGDISQVEESVNETQFMHVYSEENSDNPNDDSLRVAEENPGSIQRTTVFYGDIDSEHSDKTPVNGIDISDNGVEAICDDSNRQSDDWEEEFENPEVSVQRLIALYSYDGAEEGTLSMDLGDEFEVLGSDVDGWIRVRRAGFIEEGFVPLAYTQTV